MRVLLDTNIWRYIVDTGSENRLFQVTRHSSVQICIAPSIVIETLRMSDLQTRRRIIEVQTRDCWNRLMPDSYLQCEDVKREMIRTHPEWQLKKKNINLFRKLRYDWIRTKGGFWEKVRTNTDAVAEWYKRQDSETLSEVREQSRDARKFVFESGKKVLNSSTLKDWKGSRQNRITGKEVVLDAWRIQSQLIWRNLLTRNTSARQWLGCELDLDFILYCDENGFLDFWDSKVRLESVPREWVRASVFGLQSERKVTDGSPTDSAIATHAIDVDFVASADKNFVAMLNRIQDQAPFKTAHGVLIQAGSAGMDDLLKLVSSASVFANSPNTRH